MQLRLFFRTRLALLPGSTFQGTRGKRSCRTETAQLLSSVTAPSYPAMTQQSRAYLSLSRNPGKTPILNNWFLLCCVSFYILCSYDQSSLLPQRDLSVIQQSDLHRQYQKYKKETLIKILLSLAEVIHLCFWKPSVHYHCSIPFTAVKAGIKVTQNEKKSHNSIRATRQNQKQDI